MGGGSSEFGYYGIEEFVDFFLNFWIDWTGSIKVVEFAEGVPFLMVLVAVLVLSFLITYIFKSDR